MPDYTDESMGPRVRIPRVPRCAYCGGALPKDRPPQKAIEPQFCSEDHRQKYAEEKAQSDGQGG